MKPLLPTFAIIALSAAISLGATIISTEVYLTVADGSFGEPVLTESITDPSPDWYHRTHYYLLPPSSPWLGLGGGRITLQTAPGETISSIELSLGLGLNEVKPWTFSFQSYGATPDIQVWSSPSGPAPAPFNSYVTLGSTGRWVTLAFDSNKRASIYFEAETSSGTFGQQYFATSTVPEPTSASLVIVFAACLLIPRTRNARKQFHD